MGQRVVAPEHRTQLDIYQEFFGQLKAEQHGELEFVIRSKSAFDRFSIKLATLARGFDQTREISNALADSFNAQSSDNLTILAVDCH